MKLLASLSLACALALAGAATAQTPAAVDPPGANNGALKSTHQTTTAAPAQGRNSFTMGQAREHIEKAGFTQVTSLAKGRDGVWRGRAKQGAKRVQVAMDFKGDVTSR